MPEPNAILSPFFGMMLLTAVVWIYMYYRRLSFVLSHHIRPQDLRTPEHASGLLPENAQNPANNLRNLLELPVLFDALCLYLYVTQTVDTVYVASAWLFLVLRMTHSAIHCTVNRVKYRFYAYFVSALVLWFMVGRAAMSLL